jgi:hypothetical protein
VSGFSAADLVQALSVGHQPPQGLTAQDETLFRAFQSNLLSLISHELRTPLMGILNALGLLEEGGDLGTLSTEELIRMARQNAQRLHHALGSLLDLAALDSGSFHARLKEVDLHRLMGSRTDAHRLLFKDRGLTVREEKMESKAAGTPVLGDHQKLARAIDLCYLLLIPRAESGSEIQLRISSTRILIEFKLTPGSENIWDTAWSQALVGYEGGVASPASAFAGVMQSEQAFLTRVEEGLGSEFLLIHEILRLHGGTFNAERKGSQVKLALEVPGLSSEVGLKAVLASRAHEVSRELGSVALVLLKIPQSFTAQTFTAEIKKNLFRPSDAVYSLPERELVALVLDDCKLDDAPLLIKRLYAGPLKYGAAQSPSDGHDPALLLPLAESRLQAALK